MFDTLTIRGGTATILWGHRPVGFLAAWVIFQHDGQWTLKGRLTRGDPFQLRQKGLLFTAPHETGRDGFWAWGIESLQFSPQQIVAKLGPPEQ
jgi:hypothetical protein